MGGKAALIMVFGFSFVFSIYQLNTGNVTTRATENYVDYYSRTMVHEIAVSGLNIAAMKLYEDYGWRGPMENIPFQGGSFTVSFLITSDYSDDTLKVYSTGEYLGSRDTVMAAFSGKNLYTQYTMFTAQENGMAWIPGDTVWGPVHTNGVLNHQNKSSIVFYGKVSAGKTIASPPKHSKTKFLGGYEVGNFLPEVDNMNSLISAATASGYRCPFEEEDTLKLSFKGEGSVDIYQNSTLIHEDLAWSDLTVNGAIYSAGPIEILGGEIDTPPRGITIGSGNDIILRDDFHYADDPETNPNSDDLLGLIANNDIIFDNSSKTNWRIQSVLMSINGSFVATEMNKSGKFDYYGSVYQSTRGNAKMFQSFQKKYKHDERLSKKAPPFYPGLSNLRLIAWWE